MHFTWFLTGCFCGGVDAELASIALPAFVAIRGRVNSDKPVKCELSDNKFAVIKEVSMKVYNGHVR